MRTKSFILSIATWGTLVAIAVAPVISGCSCRRDNSVAEDISDDGLLLMT